MAVETERGKHNELDRDDNREDPYFEIALVEHRKPLEAKLEGSPPGDADQERVDDELATPITSESTHAMGASWSALATAATTCSCCSCEMPAHMGRARFSAAALSVSGRLPGRRPSGTNTGCMCSGVA